MMILQQFVEKCRTNYVFQWGPVHFVYQGNEKKTQVAGEYNMQIKDFDMFKNKFMNTEKIFRDYELENYLRGLVEGSVQRVINRSEITEDEVEKYKTQILETATKNLNDKADVIIFNLTSLKKV